MGFAVGLQHGFSVEQSIRLAHQCGAIAVQYVGIPVLQAFAQVIPMLSNLEDHNITDIKRSRKIADLSLGID